MEQKDDIPLHHPLDSQQNTIPPMWSIFPQYSSRFASRSCFILPQNPFYNHINITVNKILREKRNGHNKFLSSSQINSKEWIMAPLEICLQLPTDTEQKTILGSTAFLNNQRKLKNNQTTASLRAHGVHLDPWSLARWSSSTISAP